jgi:molybdopterin-synthase adenylyltransferase
MRFSVAMAEEMHDRLCGHLARRDGQEDLCFALWYPSNGYSRTTALLSDVVLPVDGDRLVHGNAAFEAKYLLRALRMARAAGAGLAFLHSHPAPGWQGMSRPDVLAESGMAAMVWGATKQPLVGLTLGAADRTWSARVWSRVRTRRFNRQWCESVRIVGGRLRVHYCEDLLPAPKPTRQQVRTVSAWGEKAQADLARLKVGVIGLGSVGSIVAEALVRTGVRALVLEDFDRAEELNRDRTLNLSAGDAKARRPKVAAQTSELREHATADSIRIEPLELSVCEDEGYRRALDCDVLFSCVDRPWPRSVLNFIAYSALIPVIDGGLLASQTPSGRLRTADWKVHIAGAGRACLRCVEQFDAGLVQSERNGDFEDPKYIQGLAKDHPIRTRENVFAFSLGVASLEMCQFVLLTVGAGGRGAGRGQNYHLATGAIDPMKAACDEDCEYPTYVARGDAAGHPGTGVHALAEETRSRSGSKVTRAWQRLTNKAKRNKIDSVRRARTKRRS